MLCEEAREENRGKVGEEETQARYVTGDRLLYLWSHRKRREREI